MALQQIDSEEMELVEKDRSLVLPDEGEVKDQFLAIKEFQTAVRSHLKEGLSNDYGTIPGTRKPTLLKPGAEKIMRLAKVACEYEIIDQISDLDKAFFSYTFKCKVLLGPGGPTIDEGVGECNSREQKYVNKNAFDIRNTILKMAKKRALVDAALAIGRLSDLFTQDLEDMDRKSFDNTNSQRSSDHIIDASENSQPSSASRNHNGGDQSFEFYCNTHRYGYNHTDNQKNRGMNPAHKIQGEEGWCSEGSQ